MINKQDVLNLIKDMKSRISNDLYSEADETVLDILLNKIEGMGDMTDTNVGGKWISCSDEIPNESNYYMACIYNSEVDDFDFRKTWFANEDDYDGESEWRELDYFEKVTAWMPLPPAYKGE